MTKYLLRRILHGLISVVAVVAIVMLLVYTLMNREQIFREDPQYQKLGSNQKEEYKYSKWEEYGYLEYVKYAEYINGLGLDEATQKAALSIGRVASKDSDTAAEYVRKFTDYYKSQGYTVVRLKAEMATEKKLAKGGEQTLFAYRDIILPVRLWNYITHLFTLDNVHAVKEDVGERGISFTWYDPAYIEYDKAGNEISRKFSPAIMGNGTKHKYLLYFDDRFPFIHQNLLGISLGTSYSVNKGVDIFDTMNSSQGSNLNKLITYPTKLTEVSADDIHTLLYQSKSALNSSPVLKARYVDGYNNVGIRRNGLSKVGYSFVIGLLAVILAYLLGLPLGMLMALKKDKLVDKIGTFYIIFIIAVPSLAYIFLFKALGSLIPLGVENGQTVYMPTTFSTDYVGLKATWMYFLPIISLALPSIANLMKWLRRYMIDQMNSDYVKFARSGGLSEGEIFSKHILKNAVIPVVHGIPGSVLGALVGAIITERVYVVPGAGNLLTEAINKCDNGVIVGVALFYALLSVVSIILGDVLMSFVDPRISFSSKAR